jgi:hypothetical protein
MTERIRKPLKLVAAPSVGHIVSAPPELIASTHTTDFDVLSAGVNEEGLSEIMKVTSGQPQIDNGCRNGSPAASFSPWPSRDQR